MNISYKFEGQGVVVTGGARGIGFQIARDFLTAGARVSIWDYSQETLDRALSELRGLGLKPHVAHVDVSQWSSCLAAAQSLPFKIDKLINNAGITRDKSFSKMTPEEFQKVIDTNLSGVFNTTKSLLECFGLESPDKRIVNISSVVALYGNFGQANYAASKAGVLGFTKTLARELGKKGFTVNAIAPGFVKTQMVNQMPSEIVKSMTDRVPVGRLGEPADISNICLFLCSREAGYINGSTVSVDGGLIF